MHDRLCNVKECVLFLLVRVFAKLELRGLCRLPKVGVKWRPCLVGIVLQVQELNNPRLWPPALQVQGWLGKLLYEAAGLLLQQSFPLAQQANRWDTIRLFFPKCSLMGDDMDDYRFTAVHLMKSGYRGRNVLLQLPCFLQITSRGLNGLTRLASCYMGLQ